MRPSSIIGITNDYEAFCFDEACDFIKEELSKDKPLKPRWIESQVQKSEDTNSTIEWMMKHNKAL